MTNTDRPDGKVRVDAPLPWFAERYPDVTGWKSLGDGRWRGTHFPMDAVVFVHTGPRGYTLAKAVARQELEDAKIDLEPLVFFELQTQMAEATGVQV